MTAPQDLVERLAQPNLPHDFVEVAYESSRLESVVDMYARAYSGKMHHELPEAEWGRLRESEVPYIAGAFRERRAEQTWTGVEYQGELIGCPFGGSSDDRMRVEEVVVVPERQAKGLGRYLTVRCMQKLHERYCGPNSYLFLGTDRRWSPALKLYHGLGFTIARVESYAMLNAQHRMDQAGFK